MICQPMRIAVILALFPGAALAQDSPEMELQRCIWVCLYDFPGASNPLYGQCVEERCSGQQDALTAADPAASSDAAAPVWTVGPTSDGQGMYAATLDADGRHRLSWLCAKGRASLLAIEPLAATSDVVFLVEDREMTVPVQVEGAAGYAQIPQESPLFAHLASGQSVMLLQSGRQIVGNFSTLGMASAIDQAAQSCR